MINADLTLISHQQEKTRRQAPTKRDCKKRETMKISIPMKGQRDWRRELPQVFENKRFSQCKYWFVWKGNLCKDHSEAEKWWEGKFYHQGPSVAHLNKEQCPIKKEENQESVKTLWGEIPTDPRLSQSD